MPDEDKVRDEDNMSFGEMFGEVLKMMTPNPDDPDSKSPCSKCVGRGCGCVVMSKRVPVEECGAFAEVGKNVVEYADGSKGVF